MRAGAHRLLVVALVVVVAILVVRHFGDDVRVWVSAFVRQFARAL